MLDERADHWQDNLILTGRILAVAGSLCLAGAAVAYLSGDVVSAAGGTWRTHMDAVFVLGTLGVSLMMGALAVRQEILIRSESTVGRSHYE